VGAVPLTSADPSGDLQSIPAQPGGAMGPSLWLLHDPGAQTREKLFMPVLIAPQYYATVGVNITSAIGLGGDRESISRIQETQLT
jgi:hypothetical protein